MYRRPMRMPRETAAEETVIEQYFDALQLVD